MQWIALRAQTPWYHHRSPTTVAGSPPGSFSVSRESLTCQQTARFFTDFPLTSLRNTDGVRLRWIENPRLRNIIPCSRLCAVNPRSRTEWLLLHNLPDSLGKTLNGKEEEKEIRDDVVPVASLDTEIELIEKAAGNTGDPRPESGSDVTIKSGGSLELSNTQKLTRAWPTNGPVDRSQPLGRQILRDTDGDLENGKFKEHSTGEASEGRRRVESSEKRETGREVWRNESPVETTNQPRGPYIPEGNDGDPAIGQLWGGSKQKKGSSSVETTETGRRVESEKRVAPTGRYGTDGAYGKGTSPSMARQKRQAPEKNGETHAGRDLWKKDRVMKNYQQPQDLTILHSERGELQTRNLEESFQNLQSNQEIAFEGTDGSKSSSLKEVLSSRGVVEGFKGRDPSFVYRKIGSIESDNFGMNKKESTKVVENNAGITNEGGQWPESSQSGMEGLQLIGQASLHEQGGDSETGKEEEECLKEEISGLLSGTREMVDYNGEKVIEVWKKGRVVKRYKPLGIEYLYGRKKPTRLYGPLNSRGEVPGSGLAPVPRRYRDRCEHDQGWSIKKVVTKVLELNHWDDIDIVLNQWVGRFNRKNFPPLMLAMTRTGALKHSARLFTWMKNQRCYRARTDIYNLMIWLYARHYRVDGARALFKEMQEWRCEPDVETYNALINVHGRARQWREALLFYDRMLRAAVPPSTGTYNNLISACGNSGQWQKALALFQKMKNDGVFVDVVTHNTVLTALKSGEQYDMAIEHFEKTLQWEVVPDRVTLNIIISCFSKMERYDEAVQLFNSMINLTWDGCHPDLVTFTTVMHVYAVCGQVENVKAVFDMMVRDGVVPNIVSYNTLIGAYGSLGMDAEAREVFESMQKVGFEPDIVSYTALMNACSKSGKPDDAASVFELMRKRSRKPNIVTYNTLIDAYSVAGRVREALGVLPDMDFDDVSPNVVTICSLIVACGRSGEIERVSSILKVAALRNIRLNVNVYNTVLSVYLNRGMFEEGCKLYATMKEEGITPDLITYAVLINGAAKVGSITQAQMCFNEMLSSGIGINVEACSALIHAYAEQGLPEAAHAILMTMKDSGCAPNVLTYTSLIHAYDMAEMPEAAIAVFEEMEALGVELDAVACSALFTVFNKCGQAEKTLVLWSKWREHFQFGFAAFTQLSKACSMLADWKTALELFDDMQLVGVNPNSTIGNNLLRSLSKAGKIEQVSKVLRQLQELGMRMTKDTYTILIYSYSMTHNWSASLEILDRYKADGLQPDLTAYKMVLKCLEKVQLWDAYAEVYDEMMNNGCSIDLELSRVMLNVLRERGQEERAHELESNIQVFR